MDALYSGQIYNIFGISFESNCRTTGPPCAGPIIFAAKGPSDCCGIPGIYLNSVLLVAFQLDRVGEVVLNVLFGNVCPAFTGFVASFDFNFPISVPERGSFVFFYKRTSGTLIVNFCGLFVAGIYIKDSFVLSVCITG